MNFMALINLALHEFRSRIEKVCQATKSIIFFLPGIEGCDVNVGDSVVEASKEASRSASRRRHDV